MFWVVRKIRVGRETGNTHIFLFGLILNNRIGDHLSDFNLIILKL